MMYEFEFTHPNKKRRKVKVQANSDQAQDLAQLATAAYESKYGVLPHEHGFKWREPKMQSEKDAEGWLNLAKAFGREPETKAPIHIKATYHIEGSGIHENHLTSVSTIEEHKDYQEDPELFIKRSIAYRIDVDVKRVHVIEWEVQSFYSEGVEEPDPKADVESDLFQAVNGKYSKREDIDRPDRYLQNEIDFIEAMFLLLPWEQFKGFMKATAMRYPFRYEHKGGGLDLDKSINYLQRLKEYEVRRK
ncbi:hypothetical protein EC99P2_00034 [Enterococcus phage EC99P2]|nr:hypothetical protein EC99P2_00034 [Enterococcus phage EC99P2]